MGRLTEVLTKRSDQQRQDVEAKLRILADQSATDRQGVLNFWNESRLPEGAWDDLIESLLQARHEPQSIRSAIRGTFRRWILHGPDTAHHSAPVFGRALTIEALAKTFYSLGYHGSINAALKDVTRMISKPVHVVRRRWRTRKLGLYVMWSTLNPSSASPFDGLPTSADRIRCILGLDRRERGQPLLLIEYVLPPNVEVRFPTVAEAYAGNEWLYYFRPSPEGEDHGWTMAWDECAHEPTRPEVVHEVVCGGQLSAPLREVS